MTPIDLATGTDRVAFVAKDQPFDVIVNIQGDEPTISGAVLDALIQPLRDDPAILVGTLIRQVKTLQELTNPNYARVIVDRDGYALYFSRAVVPYQRDVKEQRDWLQHYPYYKHIGIYAFQKDFLQTFVTLLQIKFFTMQCMMFPG